MHSKCYLSIICRLEYMHTYCSGVGLKYLYMSRKQRRIKRQSNIIKFEEHIAEKIHTANPVARTPQQQEYLDLLMQYDKRIIVPLGPAGPGKTMLATCRAIQTMQKGENEKLKERLKNLDKGYPREYGARLDSQLTQAKSAYRDAHESGNVDAMLEAQQALSKIAIEQERYRLAKQRQEKVKVQQGDGDAIQRARQPVQQAQPVAQPDPKAKGWAEKNEWVGQDEVMTYAAFGIHRRLVEEEGFDPKSDEYYDEIDRRMKSEFPTRFSGRKNGGSNRVASADTSASRSTKQGRRSVKLTPSQVAIAKKLGVPLEEYAKYVKE